MASTAVAQLFALGQLAAARGKLGPAHSRATQQEMAITTSIMTDPHSYGRVGTTVICVEDRLHRPDPRLAGGALALALMHNFLFEGRHLSANLQELKTQGFRLALHEDCGALNLVASLAVIGELANTDAEGYKLLSAIGVEVPLQVRQRISRWAQKFPADYVDRERSRSVVHEIDKVEGEHNAVAAAVSLEVGASFTAGPRLKQQTNGLLAFAFDPWVAHKSAQRIGVSRPDIAAAEALALVFTAQVFLTLGGPDLQVALHQ